MKKYISYGCHVLGWDSIIWMIQKKELPSFCKEIRIHVYRNKALTDIVRIDTDIANTLGK
jgi:hypothetical protein